MTFREELQTRNFSKFSEASTQRACSDLVNPQVYTGNGKRPSSRMARASGLTTTQKRTGVICIFLCFAVGIAAIFDFGIYILFAVLCLFVPAATCAHNQALYLQARIQQNHCILDHLHRDPFAHAHLPDVAEIR